ncbi:mannose-6-phosphate isomerase [Clostridium acetobutylicum]|nr:mannose-6-phosphate isomerase [Clostridium acetobutylicum]
MDNRINIHDIDMKYICDPEFKSNLKTELIGDAVGTEKFYINIDYVKPGGESVKYHSHSSKEEFFMIIDGEGILRVNGREVKVREGDVISFPAGKSTAHQFINSGEVILKILDVGTREEDDVITYPDENVVYIKDKKLVFNINDSIKGWKSDPNT